MVTVQILNPMLMPSVFVGETVKEINVSFFLWSFIKSKIEGEPVEAAG